MTGITSISGSGSDMIHSLAAMAQLLRQQRINQVEQAPQTVQDGDGDNDGSASGSTDKTSSSPGGNDLGSLFQNIESAVTTALRQSPSSVTDANQTVESAISQALQQTPSQKTSSSASGQTQAADNDGDNDASTGSTQAADSAARQAFFKLLTDNGIAPEQFRNDLVTAIQNSENGQVDRGTAFQSVPAGLTVDAMA